LNLQVYHPVVLVFNEEEFKYLQMQVTYALLWQHAST